MQGFYYASFIYSSLKTFKLVLPLFEEQQKIAEFLSSLDKKIDLVNSQIDKTKEFKKGLFNKCLYDTRRISIRE